MDGSKVITKALVAGKAELDFCDSGWESFRTRGRLFQYTVVSADIGRPDLLSLRVYDDERYWWILLKFNGICDVWNDLRAGLVLRCPSKSDMERWYTAAIRRK